jgi:hypothetical protein
LPLITLILFIMAWASTPAWAELDFEDASFPEFATSARALAMGNAYICKVDDSWSAFYNPAGLGTVRKPALHLFNVHVEGSSTYNQAVGQGPVTDVPGNVQDSFDAAEMRSMLVNNEGKLASYRANFFPNFTVRGFTLGYLFSQRGRAIVNTPVATGTYEVAERRDQGPVFALNLPLFGGVFKIGASATYLMRRELYKEFGPNETASITDADYQTGKGLQVVAGARLTLPVTFLPTLAVVLHNATANDWEGAGSGGAPDKIKQTVDVGASITPQIGKFIRVHLEANLKDLHDAYDTDAKRRLGVGMELDFNRRIFVRAGSGDGWGSGGIGVRSRTFIMDLTTYAVDRSADGFREDEDRRFVLSLSSGI